MAARQYEVPIALGTDAGSPAVDHGIAMIDEMKILMEAGFSIEKTIRCATFNGAQLLGIRDLGLLVPGNTEYRISNKEFRMSKY